MSGRSTAAAGCLCALAAMATGCGGPVQGRSLSIDGGVLSYQAEPQGFSGTDQFNWVVSSSEAFVRYEGTALTAGQVHATILDNAGQVILDQTMDQSVPKDGPTQPGQPGQWQVRLQYQSATGTVDIEAQSSAAN